MQLLLSIVLIASLICTSYQNHDLTSAQLRALSDHIDIVKEETARQIENVTKLIELSEYRMKQKLEKVLNILTVSNGNATEQTTEKLKQIYTILQRHLEPELLGRSQSNPATSCREILEESPDSPSGEYWLENKSGGAVKVYCEMDKTCGGITGGWMQLANINMDNLTHSCPSGLTTLTSPRRCGKPNHNVGSVSAIFDVYNIPYQKVCGKLIGYQYHSTNAFYLYYNNRQLTIDDIYVDGMSLTHGKDPRSHIWTFANAYSDTQSFQHTCPCTKSGNSDSVVPPYVGSDYFCDTAVRSGSTSATVYTADPLWDGAGCGSGSTCCKFNTPPWFMKQLSSATSDDIELRICHDQGDENIYLKEIELYVK